MKLNSENAKTVGAVVIVLALLVGALSALGLFPWATQKDLDELKSDHKAQIVELKSDYKALVALKNVDNEWYRELSNDFAGFKVRVEKNGEDITEIKGDIKEILRRLPSR